MGIGRLSFALALLCQVHLTAQTASPPAQIPSAFVEAGGAAGPNLMGGLGVAMTLANNQQIFGEVATQSGEHVGPSSLLLVGLKTNYPGFNIKGRTYSPFTILAYGAAIDSIATSKLLAPAVTGISAGTVSSIGTIAGFAQQYAAGFESTFYGWNVGLGMSLDKTNAGWKGFPFLFVGREFGTRRAKSAP